MRRALAKAGLLFAFGRMPGGPRLYRTITRSWMGTQATHVDKLQRVWPGYVDVWRTLAEMPLQGATTWIYDGGWTPFPFFVNHLVTGRAGIVTNRSGTMLDRYLARAVTGAVMCELPADLPLADRRADLEGLRWAPTVRDAVEQLGGSLHEGIDPTAVPLASASVDLCHSGGTLEHHTPSEVAAFLREAMRILRPGGVMSHVFDHRDHLHHADASWPYLAHLGVSDPVYRALYGHPLQYHNRLLPGEVEAFFAAAGFERIAVRRMVLPSRRYVDTADEALEGEAGIERTALATRFRTATDADLRTAAAHYLYRKAA